MVLIQERVIRGITQKDKWPLYDSGLQLLIRVRKMSALGSIGVIILVYTGQTDLKQIVSQNNKMILFYFHGSVKHFNIMNACSVVDLIILKAEPDC